jgi:hypothetical protein
MLKYLIIPIFFFAGNLCLANMASPIQARSYPMSAVSSKDMDILKENIHIKIDTYFQRAFYKVEYTIQSEKEGFQIPLLFHARDYYGKFKVWLDGKEVELKEFPYKEKATTTKLNHFLSSQEEYNGTSKPMIEITHDKDYHRQFPLFDFHYFEVNLSKGIHKIYVEYIGKVWEDNSDWVTEYSFRYFLAPVKEWKSFHELNLTIDASEFDQPIHSNLGPPDSGSFKGTASWKFSEIPTDYIQITFSPKATGFAKFLIDTGPLIIAIVFILILLITHILMIWYSRKYSKDLLAKFIVIGGSFIFPLFILMSFGFAYLFIDYAIGSYASGYHAGGYAFLLTYLYVILMPLYWIGMHNLGKEHKKYFAAKKSK